MSLPKTPKSEDGSAKVPRTTVSPKAKNTWTFAELRLLATLGAICLVFMLTPGVMRYFGAPWIETIFLMPVVWCLMIAVAYLGMHFLGGSRSGPGDSVVGESYSVVVIIAVFLGSILAYLVAKLIQFLFF